jgi:Ca-activated chloride channel family protein
MEQNMNLQPTLLAFCLTILFITPSCVKQVSEQQKAENASPAEGVVESTSKPEGQKADDLTTAVIVAEPPPEKIEEPSSKNALLPTDEWEIGIPDTHGDSSKGVPAHAKISGLGSTRFLNTLLAPLSTFSIDVDTASYSRLRTAIKKGRSIYRFSTRIEEMINYFPYLYPFPTGDPIAIHAEATECFWNKNHHLLLVGLQSENPYPNPSQLPPSNFVFLIDVSGSMASSDRLPLLKTGLEKLIELLRPIDRISIVTYSDSDRVLAEGLSGLEKAQLIDIVDQLTAAGGTAGTKGLMTAYDLAHRNFIQDGNNRIILSTDGDFNIGPFTEKQLVDFIELERDVGVFLTILGFDVNSRSEARMEALSNHGDGNYFIIDTEREAERVLVSRLHSNLHTLAKDVKIQVSFNPNTVKSYRLLGYRNRGLGNHDFEDDLVDAGEIGPDQQVTALYEVELAENFSSTSIAELATVGIRYKFPEEDISRPLEHRIDHSVFPKSADNLNVAASVAALGLFLQEDPFLIGDTLSQIQRNLEPYLDSSELVELYQLVETLKQREE